MKVYTYEECKEKLNKCGYEMLIKEEEYIGTQNNIPCKKDGYISYVSISDLLFKSKSKRKCNYFGFSNPYYKENIQTFLSEKDPKAELKECKIISKGKRKRILLTIKCECGNIFNRVWDDVKDNIYGTKCSICCKKKRGFNHRKDKQEFLNLFIEKGYTILDPNKEYLRNEYIEVENPDGYRGFISYNRLLQNRNIAIFDVRTNQKNYIYNANVWAEINNIGTKVIDFTDEKKYTRRGIKCKCSCGKEFITSIASFQKGKNRCDSCTQRLSKYENIVKSFLESQKISYISQYRINSCRDVFPLPFDFYINGKLIEVDGQGHYKVCHFNQIGYENAVKAFEITKAHDLIKTQYCEKYNIPLLRIPYWEVENEEYKNKIIQFLGE